MSKTFVIAEAAGCHDGDHNKAMELVNQAAEIGADAVKFQWCSDPDKLAQRRRAPEYVSAYRNLQFPGEWFDTLRSLARFHKLEFMCTVYLPEDIAVVAPFVDRFKVSSFEALDDEFVEAHAEYNKQTIISYGMAAMNENMDELHAWPRPTKILYCVSAYPTPYDQINLANLRPDEDGIRVFDGLSDHTTNPMTGALAVAAGAEIIEFHTRLDSTSSKNADYLVSRGPTHSHEYINLIRLAETMMGEQVVRVQDCEKPMLKYRVMP